MKLYTTTLVIILFGSSLLFGQAYGGKNQSSDTPSTTNESKEKVNVEKPIQLELTVKGVYDYGSSFAVRLIKKESDAKESLIMIIGECEANGLTQSLYGQKFSRPLTYDLFSNVFTTTSIKLDHVYIRMLDDGTYFAFLVIDDHGKIIKIDARPSDAMNIALRAGVPIYADQKVWDENKEIMEFND